MTEREKIVVGTLRFIADGWIRGEDDQRWCREVAGNIELGAVEWCCPLCAEIVCDEGCPLEPIGRLLRPNGEEA